MTHRSDSETLFRFPESHVGIVAAYLRGLPSDATRAVYRQVLRDFFGCCKTPLAEVTRRHVESYRAHLEAAGRSRATVKKHLAALSGFFSYALDEGEVASNPAANARRPKATEDPIKQGITPAETRSLLDACDRGSLIGLRDYSLVMTLAVQALRISECLGLHTEHVRQENGHQVADIVGKGGKKATIPLAAPVSEALTNWIDASKVTGPIYVAVLKGDRVVPGKAISKQSAWKRVRHLAREAGIDRPLHPHLFRHGCATSALAAGVPLHRVQDHLRHADPRTTRRYDAHRKSLNNPTGPVVADLIDHGEVPEGGEK